MANPIVITNVTQTVAPTPSALQRTGALLSQGGTTLSAGTYSLLTQLSDLTALLASAADIGAIAWSGGTVTVTVPSVGISSGTYDSGTGTVTLTLASSLGAVEGSKITVSGATGTGSYADIDGDFTASVGTGGTTVVYTIATSLTMTITGGTFYVSLARATSDKFLTTVAGCTPTGYNGTYEATVATSTTFTYALASNPGASSVLGTYTPPGVAELTAMAMSFFAQGALQAVYVLELGNVEDAAAITELGTFITANPNFFYAYLVPESWDSASSFLTFVAGYESTTSKTYFYVTTTSGTYTRYTALMKCVYWLVPSPDAPVTEFSCAGPFWDLLATAPSSTSRVAPFEYRYQSGLTPWSDKGTAATLTAIKSAGGNYLATGAEGGISNVIVIGGQYADKNPVNYWYSADWAQINVDLDVSNAVINGSNDPINPLYYNQPGIDRLQQVAAARMSSGITFGLVLNPVQQTALDGPALDAALDAGTYAAATVVNAVPFATYSAENPGDYKIGKYAGFAIAFTPLRGFDQIVFNINVSNFA